MRSLKSLLSIVLRQGFSSVELTNLRRRPTDGPAIKARRHFGFAPRRDVDQTVKFEIGALTCEPLEIFGDSSNSDNVSQQDH